MENENERVDVNSWVPVGNLLMLKGSFLNKPDKFLGEEFTEKQCYEVLQFGSAYKAPGLEDVLMAGDKVLIIEDSNSKSNGTRMSIGSDIVWFYPPKSVAVVFKKKEEDDKYDIIPVNDFVVLKRHASEKKLGNLFIPSSAEEASTQAYVAFVGTGKSSEDEEHKFEVKVGDHVLVSKHSKNDITINGEEYLIVKDVEILAKSK